MCNDQDCGVLEALPQLLLDEIVSLHVHVCGGLVENENPGLSQCRPCKADQLLLTNREKRLGDNCLKLFLHFGGIFAQFDLFEHLPNSRIVVLSERINVLPNCALQEKGDLRDVGDSFPQDVQAELLYIDTIDKDLSFGQLDEPEQRLKN